MRLIGAYQRAWCIPNAIPAGWWGGGPYVLTTAVVSQQLITKSQNVRTRKHLKTALLQQLYFLGEEPETGEEVTFPVSPRNRAKLHHLYLLNGSCSGNLHQSRTIFIPCFGICTFITMLQFYK